MTKEVMLTTSDNPWDPFERFSEWYAFDESEKHYCTSGLIARFDLSSPNDTEEERRFARVQAINRVLELFPFGPLGIEKDTKGNQIVYVKVEKEEKA